MSLSSVKPSCLIRNLLIFFSAPFPATAPSFNSIGNDVPEGAIVGRSMGFPTS